MTSDLVTRAAAPCARHQPSPQTPAGGLCPSQGFSLSRGSDPCADSGGSEQKGGATALNGQTGAAQGEAEAGTEAAEV